MNVMFESISVSRRSLTSLWASI